MADARVSRVHSAAWYVALLISDEYLDLRWVDKMLECRGTNKDIFGALDYRVEVHPWDEDEDEDENGDCDDDNDDQGVKSTKRVVDDEDEDDEDEDEDDELPNYVFIYDPPKRSDE